MIGSVGHLSWVLSLPLSFWHLLFPSIGEQYIQFHVT